MSELHPSNAVPVEPEYDIAIDVEDEFAAQVNSEALSMAIAETLRRQAVREASLTLVIAGDEEVRRLNHEFLGIDAVTDVLSFASSGPAEEAGQASEKSLPASGFVLPPELRAVVDRHLGDLIIAFPYAAKQAAQYGNSILSELRMLAVHGTLHLLGYDHDTPEAEARMWAAQEAVLESFGDKGLSVRRYDT